MAVDEHLHTIDTQRVAAFEHLPTSAQLAAAHGTRLRVRRGSGVVIACCRKRGGLQIPQVLVVAQLLAKIALFGLALHSESHTRRLNLSVKRKILKMHT